MSWLRNGRRGKQVGYLISGGDRHWSAGHRVVGCAVCPKIPLRAPWNPSSTSAVIRRMHSWRVDK